MGRITEGLPHADSALGRIFGEGIVVIVVGTAANFTKMFYLFLKISNLSNFDFYFRSC